MINSVPFRDLDVPLDTSFQEMSHAEARVFLKWYQYAADSIAPKLISDGFNIEPVRCNLYEICENVQILLEQNSRQSKLPDHLLADRRKLLNTKWAFLYDEYDLSPETLKIALSASIVISWACLQEVPDLPWYLPLAKNSVAYHRPVFAFDFKWDNIDPIGSCISECYAIVRGEQSDAEGWWKLVSLFTHELQDSFHSR